MTTGQNTVQTLQQTAPKESATDRVFRAIKQALLSILIALVTGTIVGFGTAETVAVMLTSKAPDWQTNLISVMVGLVVGYGAAATATIIALVVGFAESVRALAGDLERAGDRVLHELETLAGVADHRGAVEGSVAHHEHPAIEPMIGAFAPTAPAPTSETFIESPTAAAVTQPNGHRRGLATEELIAPLVPTPAGS